MAPPPVPPKRPDVVLTERPGWDEQPAQARDESPQVPKSKWGPSYAEPPAAPKSASCHAALSTRKGRRPPSPRTSRRTTPAPAG
eukprot:5573573-Amphidinium_carterae.1